jgi:hypothetical protein
MVGSVLVLLVGVSSEVLRSEDARWHHIHIRFQEDCIRHSVS